MRYGTCFQGTSQFYLHTHMFIRNGKLSHTCLCLPSSSWYSYHAYIMSLFTISVVLLLSYICDIWFATTIFIYRFYCSPVTTDILRRSQCPLELIFALANSFAFSKKTSGSQIFRQYWIHLRVTYTCTRLFRKNADNNKTQKKFSWCWQTARRV